jgi:enterochelin esterase-like enzyme
MKKTIILIICSFLIFGTSNIFGQQDNVNLSWNPQKNTQNLVPYSAKVITPEVFDDHTVIFRVQAPDAKKVALSWQILLYLDKTEPIPFEKSKDGIWTLKVGPLTPDIYYYLIDIDGVSVIDPSNTMTGYAGMPGWSILVVHGDGPAFYDAKNVPHGIISRIIYHSEVTGGEREMFVYTPPDYNINVKYPVLYLFGGSGELAGTWSEFGRVNFIIDNLIAEGKAIPMVIVMPNNQMVHRSDPKHSELTFNLLDREITTQVMPIIDRTFSVRTDKHGRAIAGLSMGGRHAQVIGFNNLDLFGSFGLFSSSESLELTPAVKDPDFNSKVDYLFIGAGTKETNDKSRQVMLHEQFTKMNIKHDYYIGGNGAHTFNTWRHLLYYEFLPKLWRNEK